MKNYRIVEYKNKRGKIWYRIQQRILFLFWTDIRFLSYQGAKYKFKKLKKAQKYIEKNLLVETRVIKNENVKIIAEPLKPYSK